MTTNTPPGLQAERTALAWTRTALAMLATGTFLTKLAADNAAPLTAAAGGVLVLTALLAWRTGRRRAHQVNTTSSLTSALTIPTAAVAALTTIAAVLIVASDIFH